ncbi:MAG: replication protein P [Pseudohongiella sp.]|uniref:replication protein P n=1 Tax=Pseudohongiella sp. TaxID=1979412 RepID=UPI0034A08A66
MKPRSGASQTGAGQSKNQRSGAGSKPGSTGPEANSGGPDQVDAINQLFAEFELAYHNQYHKAYGDPDRLVLAKKYWLECLADFHPQQLVTAARRLVKTQDYLPTISAVIRACEESYGLFGLPSERDAYTEACRAPAPKAAYAWSHPAVYQAGKSTDWFLLATEAEDKVFPVFAYYYRQLCQRVIRGEDLQEPIAPALEKDPSRPLTFAEREKKLAQLRASLDI